MKFSSIFTISYFATIACVVRAAPSLAPRQNAAPTVKVYNGSYVGASQPGLGSEVFLGMPYAQPPVGSLRLRQPQPLNTSWTGAHDATEWGNVCPGVGISSTPNASYAQNYVLNEDCLNINIIRPAGVDAGANLPVLFWIFGGGFTQGTAEDPRYNGSYLVQRSVEQGKPIIFASINYRLNAFGFPAGQEAADEGILNLGIRDQRLALHWVQENIYYFGGDPNAVTIWGQSAGGSSCVLHMVAYGGRDDNLFRASQVDSGVFLNGNASLATATPGWNKFVNATGCSNATDTLDCLRSVPYATYYNASVNTAFSPSIVPDGDILQSPVPQLIKEGKFVNRPAIFGSNQDEGTSGIGAPTGINTDAQFLSVVANTWKSLGISNATIQQFGTLWPDDPADGSPHNTGDGTASTGFQDKRVFSLYTDAVTAGTRLFSKAHSAVAPTWSFRFWQVPDNSSIELGAYHLAEVPYFMGVLNRTARNPLGYRPDTLALSQMMQTFLINYVNTGNPNEGTAVSLNWPSYATSQQALVFLRRNASYAIDDNYRSPQIEFLTEIALGVTPNITASSTGGPAVASASSTSKSSSDND